YLDVELRDEVVPDELCAPLTDALPEGIAVTGAAALVDRAPALQESVTLVGYRVDVADSDGNAVPPGVLDAAAERALASDSLPVTRTRKGRESTDDLRPAIRTIELLAAPGHDGSRALELTLYTASRGARPREVLDAMSDGDLVFTERYVLRTAQWIERDGA